MKCKACDNPLSDNQQWWYVPQGHDERVAEILCLKCLGEMKRHLYNPEIDDSDDPLTFVLGTRHVHLPDD